MDGKFQQFLPHIDTGFGFELTTQDIVVTLELWLHFRVNLKDLIFAFEQLKGRKVLIVNTASECGYTPQYAELQDLYAAHKDKGLVVLGFPSNEFGEQEPGDEKTIATFCEKNYGVTFPMMSKVMTKGEHQHPVYQWLTQKAKNGALDSVVKWNFGKYLINEDGSFYTMLASAADPLSPQVLAWLDGKK